VLAGAALFGAAALGQEPASPGVARGSPYDRPADPYGRARPDVGWLHPVVWLAALGTFTLAPAVVYASAMPDHRPYLGNCGSLRQTEEPNKALIHMTTPKSTRATILFEDPLCPTCRAFHERLLAEGVFDKLDVQMVMFPLDKPCNWMLSDALHPGACLISRAVLCGGPQAREVLEWSYENQDDLAKAGKAGEEQLKAAIQQRWGVEL